MRQKEKNYIREMKSRLLFTAMVLMASCTGNCPCPSCPQDRLEVSLELSRVALDDWHTVWLTGDDLSVFYGSPDNELWRYAGENGSRSGEIVSAAAGRREPGSGQIYAVYPYNSGAVCENGVITTLLPTEQPYRGTSYGRSLLAAKCAGVDGVLNFSYATAMLRLHLEDCGGEISEVFVEGLDGERIAGTCTIDLNGDTPVTGGGDSGRVTLVGPVSAGSGKDFIFSIIPTVFRKGCRFTVLFSDGRVKNVLYSKPFTSAPGEMVTIGADGREQTETFTLSLLFSDRKKMYWPFCGTYGVGDCKLTAGKTIGPLYPEEYPDRYPFYMYQATENNGPLCVTSDGGLRIGGRTGDWFKFPAIEGYRLASISCVVSYQIKFKVTDEYGSNVQDSEIKLEGDFGFIPLVGTKANRAYRIVTTSSKNGGILSLSLNYERI